MFWKNLMVKNYIYVLLVDAPDLKLLYFPRALFTNNFEKDKIRKQFE